MIEHIERAALAGEDVFGGFAPDEGLRLGVVLEQVVVDCAFEIVDAGVAAAADALCRDLGEEALDEVQPGRAGGCEVQLEPGMLLQPGLHLGRLVGGVVVENQMYVARCLHGPVDAAQKAEELPGAVAWHAFPDDQARFDVQCGEEHGCAMVLVVVGHRGRPPILERQIRLRPIERLDLRLLIDAEHDRAIRRINVVAEDFGDFLLEHRVVRDLEPFHDMRPETRIGPDAPGARGRYAHRLRHHRAAPARGIARRLLHSLRDHLQPDLPGKRRHSRGPGLVALEPRHTFIEIPLLPPPDRRLRHARLPGELARRIAVGRQSLKLGAVGGAKIKADVGASLPPFMPRLSSFGNTMSGVEH